MKIKKIILQVLDLFLVVFLFLITLRFFITFWTPSSELPWTQCDLVFINLEGWYWNFSEKLVKILSCYLWPKRLTFVGPPAKQSVLAFQQSIRRYTWASLLRRRRLTEEEHHWRRDVRCPVNRRGTRKDRLPAGREALQTLQIPASQDPVRRLLKP